MVMPGPGEVQLIGYDPAAPSATPLDEGEQQIHNPPPTMSTATTTPPPMHDPGVQYNIYVVTFQVKVRATNPINAQIHADTEGGELLSCSAELVEENT